MSLFIDEKDYNYIASFLSSNLAFYFLRIINPTLAFQIGNIKSLPIIFPESIETKQKIDQLTQQNIDISKEEWDSRETSWDFTASPLIENGELRMQSLKILIMLTASIGERNFINFTKMKRNCQVKC